jgi:hypothetical protein
VFWLSVPESWRVNRRPNGVAARCRSTMVWRLLYGPWKGTSTGPTGSRGGFTPSCGDCDREHLVVDELGNPYRPEWYGDRFATLTKAAGLPVIQVVESARGAVSVLPPVCFPGPLAEPVVPISRQRALHGCCRQAGFVGGQGVGI